MPPPRRTPPRVAAPLLMVLLAALGCGPEAPPSALSLAVSPTPATVGPARVLVLWDGHAAGPVPGGEARVVVRAVDPTGTVQRTDTARRETPDRWVSRVRFPTRGDWTLRARLEEPGREPEEAEMPIRVVGGARPDPD